jgi:hypothetical protein
MIPLITNAISIPHKYGLNLGAITASIISTRNGELSKSHPARWMEVKVVMNIGINMMEQQRIYCTSSEFISIRLKRAGAVLSNIKGVDTPWQDCSYLFNL